MALYTTAKRVRRLLGMKGSDDIHTEVVDEAIQVATDLVQGYIGKDNATAVEAVGTGESTPTIIRSIATTFAAYIAYSSVYAAAAAKDSNIAGLYEKAEDWAEQIRDGKIDIRDITTQFQAESNREDYGPALGIDEPTEWSQDTNLTSDLEDDRE